MLRTPTAPPLAACRAYLVAVLAERGIDVPVGINPPDGTPGAFILVSQLGSDHRGALGDYLLRARVFDADAYRCIVRAALLHAALMGAAQRRIDVPDVGSMWVTGARHRFGPSDLDDPDVPLYGQEMAVSWTTTLKPIQGAQP